MWFKTFSGYRNAISVHQTTDGGYIFIGQPGQPGSDLIKTAPDGTVLWTHGFSGGKGGAGATSA